VRARAAPQADVSRESCISPSPPAAWVGRLAMLAVAYFAAEEVLGGTPELLGSA